MPRSTSKSNARKKRDSDADSDDSSDSISSKPNSDEKPSTSTNAPSSVTVTVSTSTGGTRHQTAQPAILPVAAAAAAAAPTAPQSEKKARRAGFREQFLQKLRVMLDRESQNEGATVRWSADGSSFVITDHVRLEEQLIPIYYGNQIVFSSFLRKLQRWGFKRVASRRNGYYEYSSPTFKRVGANTAPAAAAATSNTAGNSGGEVASLDQHPSQASALLHQVMAQVSQLQSRSRSQITANTIGILQSIIGSNQQQQQPSPSQNSLPSQHPSHNHATSQQQQHQNPMMNLLNTIQNNIVGGSTSSCQAIGHSPPSSQSSAIHALLSLSGLLPQPPLLNSNPPLPAASQPMENMMPAQLLLMLLQRINEEEQQRRAQVDALHQVIIATIGHIVERNNIAESEAQSERRLAAAQGQGQRQRHTTHRQTVGRTEETRSQNERPRNPTGMTVRVEHSHLSQPQQQVGAPVMSSAGNRSNAQADLIAFLLQAAQRGDGTAQPPEEDTRAQHNDPVTDTGNDGEDNEADSSLSPRKRKSSKRNQQDSDDDSWNRRLRPRKKSPPL